MRVSHSYEMEFSHDGPEASRPLLAACCALLFAAGCAARYEALASTPPLASAGTENPMVGSGPPGSLSRYRSLAAARSPELVASRERWRAESLRIEGARALPDPTVTYGVYARPVHTRVGAQRHRIGARQRIPWPTQLISAADAQSASALAARRTHEAQTLVLTARVGDAYWRLWYARAALGLLAEQGSLLRGLADSLRGRMEVGGATLADVAQVDLAVARLEDMRLGLEEVERRAVAALRADIGEQGAFPTNESPVVALPGEPREALRAAVTEHPLLETFSSRAAAADAMAEMHESRRFPSFTLGVDWMETGPAIMPTPNAGDDALLFSVGLSVPIWQSAHERASQASQADARAERASRQAALDAAQSQLETALSRLSETHRRAVLYRGSMLPQAEAAYHSVMGAYTAGRGSVVAMLLAQRELLELSLGLQRVLADHARAWVALERIVGRRVARGDLVEASL